MKTITIYLLIMICPPFCVWKSARNTDSNCFGLLCFVLLCFGTDCHANWQLPISLKMNRYFLRDWFVWCCVVFLFCLFAVSCVIFCFIFIATVLGRCEQTKNLYIFMSITENCTQDSFQIGRQMEMSYWMSNLMNWANVFTHSHCKMSLCNNFVIVVVVVERKGSFLKSELKWNVTNSWNRVPAEPQNVSPSQSIWDALTLCTSIRYQAKHTKKGTETNLTKTARIDLWSKRSSN